MEEEFKGKLAEIWGVEDEDELPDSLQVCWLRKTIDTLSAKYSPPVVSRVFRSSTSMISWRQGKPLLRGGAGWCVISTRTLPLCFLVDCLLPGLSLSHQMEQISASEGFSDDKTATVEELVTATVEAIRKLEDDYVKK